MTKPVALEEQLQKAVKLNHNFQTIEERLEVLEQQLAVLVQGIKQTQEMLTPTGPIRNIPAPLESTKAEKEEIEELQRQVLSELKEFRISFDRTIGE